MAKHRDVLSSRPMNDPTSTSTPVLEQSELLTNSLHNQATEIAGLSYIVPTTPLIAPKSASQPLPIKVFLEMSLSV
jgi:hypothetical protein